jgi:hypothetical protein
VYVSVQVTIDQGFGGRSSAQQAPGSSSATAELVPANILDLAAKLLQKTAIVYLFLRSFHD